MSRPLVSVPIPTFNRRQLLEMSIDSVLAQTLSDFELFIVDDAETFPLEIRALAIAFFFSVGAAIGGIGAPWLFGALIDTGSRMSLFGGYLLGAALMLAAALIAFRFGVAAERKPLEAVATPLSAAD